MAPELRVMRPEGENFGVLAKAGSAGQSAGSEFRLDRNIPHRPAARGQDNGFGQIPLPTAEKTERRGQESPMKPE